MQSKIQLSVIVCTFNRAPFLRRCLAALVSQSAPAMSYEVLVVDNKSTDTTAEDVAQVMACHANVRYVLEDRQGLSHARNRGLRETASPWVAYVDDDGEVFRDFVEQVIEAIKHEPFDAFGGLYLPKYPPGKPSWFLNEYASNAQISPQTCSIPHGTHWFSGGICAFSRSALEAVGGFPVGLGMTGRKLAYGEETLVQVRMHRAGYRLGFVPAVCMNHWVLPYKYRLWYFANSAYGFGRDSWATFDLSPRWRLLLLVYGSTMKRCLIASARMAVSWRPGIRWRSGACVAEMLMALGNAVGSTKGFIDGCRRGV